MKNAVEMSKMSTVQCDTCDYKVYGVKIKNIKPEYHNKPCPKCGAILIDDDDLAGLAALEAACELANSIFGQIPDDVEYKKASLDFGKLKKGVDGWFKVEGEEND